jgi:c-di-AMP phosphodiesterase-like protein
MNKYKQKQRDLEETIMVAIVSLISMSIVIMSSNQWGTVGIYFIWFVLLICYRVRRL